MRKLRDDFGKGFVFPRKNNEDHKNHLRTIEKHVKLHNQDWRNVVVINMHPFPVQQGFGDAGLLVIKGCEEGKPYRSHLIDMYRITKADHGNADYEPVEILPVEQAMELERKYHNQGGIFWHYTDEVFPSEKLQEAGQRQLQYYRALVRKARDEWARHHSMVRISDAMRNAAKYLANHDGLDISDFGWLDIKKIAPVCEQCGEDYKKGAKICKHCQWPLDKAWVVAHRPDIAEKHGLTADKVGYVSTATAQAEPATAEGFLDEGMQDDDALLGGADMTPLNSVRR